MKISANGISYFLDLHQQNPELPHLLLLHGFMGSGHCFNHLIEPFGSFCNPVTVDLLGHGETEGADFSERFSAGNQISDLKSVIERVFDAPPYLHGYSMGGRLALRFAITHPNSIRGLILESTNYGLEDENKISQRKKTDGKRARAIEKNFKSFLQQWHQLPLFQKGISLPGERLNHYHTIQENQRPKQIANSLRAFGTAQMPSVKEHLININIPVLLLAGQVDFKYAKITRQMHKMISKSLLSIIPNAGHRIHLEHPEAFISEIKSFITKT